ncbi:MAG: translation initiation factor IF-2 [Phycisphaerales bacterium JB064]
MAKRVFEIAKELGVASKAVVQKCRDEGIPESVIKNHMSTVSVGLEATVREWFSGGEAPSATAVETSKPVNLEKVRAKPRARKKQADESTAGEESTTTGTAVAEPPARATRPSAAPQPEDEGEGDEQEPTVEAPAGEEAAVEAPAKPEPKPEPKAESKPEPKAQPAAEAPAAPAVEAPKPDEAPAQSQGEDDGGQRAAASAPAAPQGESPKPAGPPPKPAPQNVPTRPTVIKPAGPMLEKKTPVKLSGPKIVRVEAPEQVDTRPRGRGGPRGGEGGGFGGPGPMGPMTGGPGGGGGGDARRGGPSSRRRGRNEPQHGGSGMWREQDLIEREAKLQQAGGYLRKRRQDLARGAGPQGRQQSPAQQGGTVKIAAPFTIKDLSAATGVKGAEIVKKLFMQGIMAQINSGIEVEKAQEIMMDFDIELEVTAAKSAEEAVAAQFEERTSVDERPRGPIVTILGHVDHGKTSLLDKIRNANVAAGEAGGITQATSAFRVPVRVGDDKQAEEKQVVFIDTPGHEAFTSMRSRGANVTDMVVLVVAADDGVMPQTIESINHAKAAGVPIVVALNKIDRPQATDAKIQEIFGQLAQHDLNPVDWGGDTEIVRTSAISGLGIQELLETLDFQAQLLELKADFGGAARGTVIESQMEPGRGAVMNVLLQEGELKVGDFIVAGRAFGRVRDITDDKGKRLRVAHPPMPLQVTGIDVLPDAGDKFFVATSLKEAQNAAEQRRSREREEQLAQPAMTLDRMFSQMAEAELKEILVVLKADVQGSVDVLRNEIEKVSGDEIKVRVIHSAVGGITESDVLLAEASKAVIIGFNVIPSGKARKLADTKGVEIRTYDVIYHITEDMQKAAEGMLDPELRQEVLGHAEVRAVFKVSKVGTIAGCYVTDGVVQRDALIRVTRGDIVIENDRKLSQLKRFKDDAKEVRANMECGMKIDGYDDIKEGDILECYKQVEVKRTL